MADATDVMISRTAGIPIKYVETIYGLFPVALIGPKGSVPADPAKLAGKRIGTRVPPEMVLPVIVVAVLLIALLVSYPWEVLSAGTIVYLASDLARPVTGQAIRVNAGQWESLPDGRV